MTVVKCTLLLRVAIIQSLVFTAQSARTIEVTENTNASIQFQTAIRANMPSAVLLNNRTIFHGPLPVEGALPPGQLGRMELQRTAAGDGLVRVQLVIVQTAREDAGTYRHEGASEGNGTVSETIILAVSYPGDDLSCAAVNDTLLSCGATRRGDASEEISCTQGQHWLQPVTEREVGKGEPEELRAQFVFDPSSVIGCCVAVRELMRPDNCSQITAYPVTTFPSSSSSLDNTTTFKNDTRNSNDRSLSMGDKYFKATIGFVSFLLAVLVILYPFGLIYHFAVIMRRPTKYDSRRKGHFSRI